MTDKFRPGAGNAQVTIQAAPSHSVGRCVGRSDDQGIGNPGPVHAARALPSARS
jgi:hypothetical protein